VSAAGRGRACHEEGMRGGGGCGGGGDDHIPLL